MRHVKLFESYHKIEQVIIELIAKYNKTPYEINNGVCEEFAMDLIKGLGGYSDNLYELSPEMFYMSGKWHKNMLDKYGYPPYDLDKIDGYFAHVWVYYDGKHYDAESPNGVNNWYDLPFIKRYFESNDN